jgi:hypothetical protein
MRLPQMRFTVRRMMVVVAISGLVIEGGKRSAHRHLMAQQYLRRLGGGCHFCFGDPCAFRIWHWEADMYEKYTRAKWLPWLSVEPDPPEPK